jgi:hypothetical protein
VGLLLEALAASTLVVTIDPRKVSNRVWLSTGGAGGVVPPLSVPVPCPGAGGVAPAAGRRPRRAGGSGVRHRVNRWAAPCLEAGAQPRFPDLRLCAPAEATASRAQLGWRRFETDDRDTAALTYLARRGQGRCVPDRAPDALAAAVRHRRGLIAEHKVALSGCTTNCTRCAQARRPRRARR